VFEGEKTFVFWIGLIILALVSVYLFGISWWMLVVWDEYMDRLTMLKYQVPTFVGGVVFILVGLYMMKSGVKRKVE